MIFSSFTHSSNPAPRFSGYQRTEDNKARLFLPGYQGNQVQAEIVVTDTAGKTRKQPVEMIREGHYWKSKTPVTPDTPYRITVDGVPVLDLIETRQVGEDTYNVVARNEADTPQKSVVIADIYADSVVDRDRLRQLVSKSSDTAPMRNHFNLYGGDEKGLKEIIPLLEKAGFTGFLLKPFMGGDNISSNRYWTVDPYVLNNTFSSNLAFKDILKDLLKADMKPFADGAFVNQGLNGIQFSSLLQHGFNSPYWHWFIHDNKPAPGITSFPRLTYEGKSIGVLPTKTDSETGVKVVNNDAFDFSILNDPGCCNTYNPKEPLYLQLVPTRKDTIEEGITPDFRQKAPLVGSEDSVQKLKFPISEPELKAKRALLAEAQNTLTSEALEDYRKQLFSSWKNFRLASASLDDSTLKWDGQVDVAKIDLENPEVKHYLLNSVAYWTRFVNNTYLQTVSQALQKASLEKPNASAAELIPRITRPSSDTRSNEDYVLPPITNPAIETLTPQEIKSALNAPRKLNQPIEKLAETMLSQYPLMALRLPEYFKSTLSVPGFQESLVEPELRFGMEHLFNLLKVLGLSRQMDAFKGWLKKQLSLKSLLFKPPIQDYWIDTLKRMVPKLSSEAQQKLGYDTIQSLISMPMAEKLWLLLLTGQTSEDPEKIRNGLYRTLPDSIFTAVNTDPKTAKNLLERFIKQRLQSLDDKSLTHLAAALENQLKPLNPQWVSLSQAILNKREYGLNWRIDAAKDIGDMDAVRNGRIEDRPANFEKTMQFVSAFWGDFTRLVRGIFKQSSVIAELTDFDLLSNAEIANKSFQNFFNSNTFTSTPNMTYIYSPLHEAIHYSQRPSEFGGSQMKPSGFFQRVIETGNTSVPWTAARQFQNLSTSHDYPSTSHTFLINPAIFTMDHLRWWGLKDDLHETANELVSKICFTGERQALGTAGIQDLTAVLDLLQQKANDPEIIKKLSQDLRNYHSENTKHPDRREGDSSFWRPTPAELKPMFIGELFGKLKPDELGISQKAFNALKETLLVRIAEPSEVRAMRAVFVNTLDRLDWNKLQEKHRLNKTDIETALWKAFDNAVQTWGTPLGYQPFDIAVTHVFQELPKDFLPQSTLGFLKNKITAKVLPDLTDKLLKTFALQVATPGNPSIYLQDLLAQGGSEWLCNRYVQDRNLLRYDHLDKNPVLQDFYNNVSALLNLRKQYPVLSDGIPIKVDINDDDGIIPIVRDNGQEQAIMLVNTGKPSDIGWEKMETGPLYKEVVATQPVKQDFKLNLKHPAFPVGMLYRDPQTNERFVVNRQGQLVRQSKPGKGINIASYRILIRESR